MISNIIKDTTHLSINPSQEPISGVVEQLVSNNGRLDKRYSVLSLDGGGVKGLLTCLVLKKIEKEFRARTGNNNFKILDAFDCVIGTSVGGLIALGLACGYSARAMSAAMEKMIPEIFKDELWIDKIKLLPINLSQLLFVGYDENNLESQLFKYLFEDNAESDSKLKGKRFATLGDLKALNPHLRVCLVSCVMDLDDVNGPYFSPRIFDTDSQGDLDK